MQLDWLKIGMISDKLQVQKNGFNEMHIHALIKNNNNKKNAEKILQHLCFMFAFLCVKMLLLLNSTHGKIVHSKQIHIYLNKPSEYHSSVCAFAQKSSVLNTHHFYYVCNWTWEWEWLVCWIRSFSLSLSSLNWNYFCLLFHEWILQHWHWLSANA